MQINTDRDRYLELCRSGKPWHRKDQRESDWLNNLTAAEQELDASDPQPVDSAKLFYSGVLAGFVYGAFAVLVWKWFR